ncbi:MAG: hypothetical protein GXP04_00970 [Alphaproteobacteria bacterium]|nr:hypothetical protein [Alphaproteobacteria bacterium]
MDMLKFVTAVAVATALCLQPAAAQLGGANSVTDTGDRAERHKKVGVVSYVVEQIQISFSVIFDRPHQATQDGDAYKYSYTKRECDAAPTEGDEEAEGAEAKDQEPTGPEPLYFGF